LLVDERSEAGGEPNVNVRSDSQATALAIVSTIRRMVRECAEKPKKRR
jgi:hypothetical protein